MFAWLFRWILPRPLPLAPKPKPFLDTPWRKSSKKEDETYEEYNGHLMDEISKVNLDKVDAADVLLIGPFQAGKSSFANTISSIEKGRIACKTAALGANDTVTQRFITIPCKGHLKNLRLKDSVGIRDGERFDTTYQYISRILSGGVKHREKLPQKVPTELDELTPNKKTVHCVIFVVDANALKTYTTLDTPNRTETKLRILMKKVADIGIPITLVLTKIDQLCREVEKDITDTFRSAKVKEAVDEARRIFGFQEMNIFPVKNYEKETAMNPFMNMLHLEAMKTALYYSFDYLEGLTEN